MLALLLIFLIVVCGLAAMFELRAALLFGAMEHHRERFEIYAELVSVAAEMNKSKNFSASVSSRFARAQSRAEVVFGEEVSSHLQILRDGLLDQINSAGSEGSDPGIDGSFAPGRIRYNYQSEFDRIFRPHLMLGSRVSKSWQNTTRRGSKLLRVWRMRS